MFLSRTFFVVAVLGMLASSCNREVQTTSDPKIRLKQYIEKSFALKSAKDKSDLESFLTGDARTRLAAWSDAQFEEAFLRTKRKFSKLFFREAKAISPTSVEVTYELTYQDGSVGSDTKVTNKKMCEMVFKDSDWYIKGCRNIKQLVEYGNEMSLP